MFEIDLQIFFSNLFLSYKLDTFLLECEKMKSHKYILEPH